MKLRPPAKGYDYRIVDLHLRIVRKCSLSYEQDVWDYDEAPAECFADAEEPTLHCGPLVAEEPVREGERVVVLGKCFGVGDEQFSGKRGIIVEVYANTAKVMFDDGTHANPNPWLRNLRREREDERPAEKKQEPPPRKYEDGQWVEFAATGYRYTVANPKYFPSSGWCYQLRTPGGDRDTYLYEDALRPCPPPLSDAQRRLQPGDEVRVRRQRWGALGKPILPSIVHPPLLSAGTILRSWGEGLVVGYRVRCAVRFGMGEDVAEYLHNLEPASESAPKAVPEQ